MAKNKKSESREKPSFKPIMIVIVDKIMKMALKMFEPAIKIAL